MHKIIPLRSQLGYAFVLALCSLFMAAHFNLRSAARIFEGMDLAHASTNVTAWINIEQYTFRFDITMFLGMSILIAIIFSYSTISSLIEAHAGALAKLSLLGASKGKIIRVFLSAILIPYVVATILGAVVGIWMSKFFGNIYLSGNGYPSHGFNPTFHPSSLMYTCEIMCGILLLAVLLNLKKLLSVNPLNIRAGKYKELGRISRIRVIAGIVMCCITAWYIFAGPTTSDPFAAASAVIYLGLFEILCFYLLVPVILKFIVPILLRIFTMVFPISGLLVHRYFNANIRRYMSIASPLIICLVVSVSWFLGMLWNAEIDKSSLMQNSAISAVMEGIKPNDVTKLHHNTIASSLGIHARATPYRTDNRWAIQNKTQIVRVVEVDPAAASIVFQAPAIAGDVNKIHGSNIASTRRGDKVGDTLHLITPSGKPLIAHIVAIYTPVDSLNGALIGDFANLPEATSTYQPDIASFDEEYDPKYYDIFYTGVSADKLHKVGLNALSYPEWVSQALKRQVYDNGLYYFQITPIVIICLCFVIINSLSFSENSRYLRKVMTMIGGSSYQDLLTFFMEIGTILLTIIIFSPLPAIFAWIMMYKKILNSWHIPIHFHYPTEQVTDVFLILALGTLIPSSIKILMRKLNSHHLPKSIPA